MFSWDLLANAVVAGLLLGGFYAAVSLGISLIFGLLDIANIAQPAFVILGAYGAYVMNSAYGLDPILTGVLFTPLFYLVGAAVTPFAGRGIDAHGHRAVLISAPPPAPACSTTPAAACHPAGTSAPLPPPGSAGGWPAGGYRVGR